MADSPDGFADIPWRTRFRDRVQARGRRAIVPHVLATATLLSRPDSRSVCRRSSRPIHCQRTTIFAVDLAVVQIGNETRQLVSQLEIKIALGVAHRGFAFPQAR